MNNYFQLLSIVIKRIKKIFIIPKILFIIFTDIDISSRILVNIL